MFQPPAGRPPVRRPGYTMIEAAVALSIVAVLILLLLVWLQASREAERRTTCQKNLMQLSLAVGGYASSWGVIPPTGNPGASGDFPQDFSMKVNLLPYLEAAPVYNCVNFQHPSRSASKVVTGEMFTVATTRIYCFSCPSEANDPGSMATVGGRSLKVESTSYPNNIGTFLGNHGGTLDGPAYAYPAGPEDFGAPVPLASVVDGLANTAIFSEFVKGMHHSSSPGLHQTYAMAKVGYDGPARPVDLAAAVADCRASTAPFQGVPGTDWDSKGELWTLGLCGAGGGYSHVDTPNQKACVFRGAGLAPHYSMIGASSNHSGGVNVTFLDGSVRFIADAVDAATWRALATKAGSSDNRDDSF